MGPRSSEFDKNLSHCTFLKARKQILWPKRAQELGNEGLYGNYRICKKSSKVQNFILVPGVQKLIFRIFPEIFYEKMSRESGNGISSETTWSLE